MINQISGSYENTSYTGKTVFSPFDYESKIRTFFFRKKLFQNFDLGPSVIF